MEALCATCPLRGGKIDYSELLETCRVRLDDADDKALVLNLPEGDALSKALSERRPKRCQALDSHLPDKRLRHAYRGAGRVLLESCPEVALIQQIMPQTFPDGV